MPLTTDDNIVDSPVDKADNSDDDKARDDDNDDDNSATAAANIVHKGDKDADNEEVFVEFAVGDEEKMSIEPSGDRQSDMKAIDTEMEGLIDTRLQQRDHHTVSHSQLFLCFFWLICCLVCGLVLYCFVMMMTEL